MTGSRHCGCNQYQACGRDHSAEQSPVGGELRMDDMLMFETDAVGVEPQPGSHSDEDSYESLTYTDKDNEEEILRQMDRPEFQSSRINEFAAYNYPYVERKLLQHPSVSPASVELLANSDDVKTVNEAMHHRLMTQEMRARLVDSDKAHVRLAAFWNMFPEAGRTGDETELKKAARKLAEDVDPQNRLAVVESGLPDELGPMGTSAWRKFKDDPNVEIRLTAAKRSPKTFLDDPDMDVSATAALHHVRRSFSKPSEIERGKGEAYLLRECRRRGPEFSLALIKTIDPYSGRKDEIATLEGLMRHPSHEVSAAANQKHHEMFGSRSSGMGRGYMGEGGSHLRR